MTVQPAEKVNKAAGRLFPRWLLAALYFAALTVFMTWPLAMHMRDSVVGDIGDNVYFVWLIGWFKKALFELHVSPFNVWFLNYPQGWSLSYTEITPINIAMALPLSFLGGPTFAYNAVLMLTFALSGLTMYLWVQHLTGRAGAGLVAGTAYAFLPYHFAHFLIGHLNLATIQWFPLYFWGLWATLEARKWSWKPALLGGIGLGLIALTSQYYLYMTILLSAFLTAIYFIFYDRPAARERGTWLRLAGMGLIALPLVAAGIAPFVSLLRQGGLPDRGLSVVEMYSASPTDFLLPSTDHFLWGAWIGSHFNRDMWVEGTLYIGAPVAVLAALAGLKRRESGQDRLLAVMLWTGMLAFVLALGTNLHWNGAPVEISAPAFLQVCLGRAELPVPLPGLLLFKYFPLYAKMRVWMRFGAFVLVFACAAAGIGAAWLLARARKRWQVLLTALLVILVLVDFYPGPYRQFARIQPRAVDAWLAQQPGKGAVAVFPFALEEDQSQVYYTLTYYGKPFVGGFFNAFPPEQYQRIRGSMDGFPDAKSVALLRELGVQYVVVDGPSYQNDPGLVEQCLALGLILRVQLDGQFVFELKP